MELQLDQLYTVKVLKTLPRGVIVELEDQSTELIHISQIADCFVKNVSDFVKQGEIYEAKGVQGNARPIELSFKHLNLKSSYKPKHKSNYKGSDSKTPDDFEAMLARSNRDLNDKVSDIQNKYKRTNRKR